MMKNKLTRKKAVEGCWRTGKNPLTCNKCGYQNECWKMYHSEENTKRRLNLRISR